MPLGYFFSECRDYLEIRKSKLEIFLNTVELGFNSIEVYDACNELDKINNLMAELELNERLRG